MKILCYGDSNTWGYDPRGPLGERYPHPWPELLAGSLSCTVVNCGENGREVPKNPCAFPSDSDLNIIMLGTNELLQFWTPEATCGKMETFLKSLNTDPERLLLIAPPTMRLGAWVQDDELVEDSVTLSRLYSCLAEKLRISFVDAGQWNIPMAHDGVHMTQEGHHIFASNLYEYIRRSITHD